MVEIGTDMETEDANGQIVTVCHCIDLNNVHYKLKVCESWIMSELNNNDDNVYVQMTYPGPNGLVMTFSTEVNILPDIFPYPKCETEEECKGRLV